MMQKWGNFLRISSKILVLAVVIASVGMIDIEVSLSDEFIRIPNETFKNVTQENDTSVSEKSDSEMPVESEPAESTPEDAKSADSETAEPVPVEPEQVEQDGTSGTTVTNTSMPSDKTIFIGLGIAGLAALGVALGSSSGGSSEDISSVDSTVPPPVSVPPVGPSIEGSWSGELRLINYGTEAVTAQITQNGGDIEIETTSTLPYGRYFSGTINKSGYIYVMDADTGQTWTTLEGNASSHHIRLYDYVNNFKNVDRLELFR